MMDKLKEIRDAFIEEKAKEIRSKLEGGSLYGYRIDMENLDEVIVAVYFMTELEQLGLLVKKDDTQ